MKVALAQVNTKIGDFEGNVRKVLLSISRAKSLGADLVAFPEMTTTGYPPRDLVEQPSFIEKNLRALEAIASEARGIAAVVGAIERNPQPGGKPLYNAAVFLREGVVRHRYFKNLLPTYDVFDEGRYFQPGTETGLWTIASSLPAMKVGISICEDAWNDKTFWEKRLYPHDPVEGQVSLGADLLLNISASPFSLGKEKVRREMLSALAARHRRPVLYVNLVGGNDELVFDGRSLAVSREGKVAAEGKAFEEDLLIVEPDRLTVSQQEKLDERELLFKALVMGIRDYVRKCGFKKLILGLSGGIDSALTAVLAARAVGPSHVMGLLMPSPYSSRESVEDAAKLARNLGIGFKKIPIGPIYASYRRSFGKKAVQPPDLADENLQARIRGNILMAFSNREGYLVLSTGNKSELAVGYCTLYGDMSGGLAVLSDLPKVMVYELARWLNRGRKPIPERIFTKPPSAELRPHQKDQDTLPPYEILDPILKAYIEEHRSEEEIVALGFPKKTVRWVLRQVGRNEYKRRQSAPGIRVTSKAFGIGRRFPIARKIQ